MQIQYSLNINELDDNFVSSLKKDHKDKNIEIIISEDETTYLTKSQAMKNRIDDARSRKEGIKLEEVVEKYKL